MQLTSIGEPFASRTLQLSHTDSIVTVAIGKPQQFPQEQDYYCPFQIIGLGDDQVRWSGGIDAIQALLLALEHIDILLKDTKEYKQGKLSWIGSDQGNLGFPQLDSSGLLNSSGLLK